MDKPSGHDRRTLFKEEAGANMDALYNTALRLTRKPEDAEDLVADTMAKAWAALDSLRNPALFRAWIFRILKHLHQRLPPQRRPAGNGTLLRGPRYG